MSWLFNVCLNKFVMKTSYDSHSLNHYISKLNWSLKLTLQKDNAKPALCAIYMFLKKYFLSVDYYYIKINSN